MSNDLCYGCKKLESECVCKVKNKEIFAELLWDYHCFRNSLDKNHDCAEKEIIKNFLESGEAGIAPLMAG